MEKMVGVAMAEWSWDKTGDLRVRRGSNPVWLQVAFAPWMTKNNK